MDDVNAELRARLVSALACNGLGSPTKESIRQLHLAQSRERAELESRFVQKYGPQLLDWFADGAQVDPRGIRPRLVRVLQPSSEDGRLFRAATLLWSVPVSRGYGRRIRYLVIDESNQKLIGLFALGDPVFNLSCRDDWIGWNAAQRKARLAFVMDAYVLGAVPPYSQLLGGKLVGAMVAAKEIQEDFQSQYGDSQGLISGIRKGAELALVTTTSALGRSSIYNRLRLPGAVQYLRLGYTNGWGHFQIGDGLFRELRGLLEQAGHPYCNNYRFGQGPNWRLRALRQACEVLGVDGDLLRHGIRREVYGVPLALNWRDLLLGHVETPIRDSQAAHVIAEMALKRWVVPRSKRDCAYKVWTRGRTWDLLTRNLHNIEQPPEFQMTCRL